MANLIPRRGDGQRGNLATGKREPFGQLQEVFDTFFDRIMHQWGGPFTSSFSPMRTWDFDVDQRENEVLVRAEMPGFEPDDIDIQLDQNTLTISAEKRSEGEREQDFRRFYRTITLPAGMDADKVQACYRNGVLELQIPRSEAARPKHIRVQGHQGQEQPPEVKNAQAATPNQSSSAT